MFCLCRPFLTFLKAFFLIKISQGSFVKFPKYNINVAEFVHHGLKATEKVYDYFFAIYFERFGKHTLNLFQEILLQKQNVVLNAVPKKVASTFI